MVVVEAVGASPSEQASFSTEQSRAASAAEASAEELPEAQSSHGHGYQGTRNRLMVASRLQDFLRLTAGERASTRSPLTIIPRSPCRAPRDADEKCGVPVELKVAAICAPRCRFCPCP